MKKNCRGVFWMNRKADAGDWVKFGGFFLIMIIIAGGIVGMYLSSSANGYNIKEAEASVLFDVVRDCFEENGLFESEEEFLEKCKLNSNVMEDRLVLIDDLATDRDDDFVLGVRDYEIQCELTDRFERFAKCRTGEFNGHRIIVGSNADSRGIIK